MQAAPPLAGQSVTHHNSQQSSFLGEFYLLFPQSAELGVDCVTLSVTQILFPFPKIMATFLYHLFPELQIYHRSFIYHMNK